MEDDTRTKPIDLISLKKSIFEVKILYLTCKKEYKNS